MVDEDYLARLWIRYCSAVSIPKHNSKTCFKAETKTQLFYCTYFETLGIKHSENIINVCFFKYKIIKNHNFMELSFAHTEMLP